MSTLPLPDLQTLAALAIGLLAAMHVLKRWWPQWRRLWAPRAAEGAPAAACSSGANMAAPSGAACGSGCGQCGSAAPTPHKDQRVHIVRRNGR
jgi:hypothetical protein